MNEPSHDTPKVKQLSIEPEFAGQRLDNFLINLLKGLPKSRLYRIIRKGEVRVNKGRIKPDYRIRAGDVIRIPPLRLSADFSANSSEEASALAKAKTKFSAKISEKLLTQIIFEDDGMLVLNKPSGMAVHGGSGLSFGVIEALRILRPDCPHLELVHRLDRETSGCLMIAKRRSTLRWLHELLRTGQIEKRYWALVKGDWRGGKVVSEPLKKNQLSSGERIVKVNADGQEALTAFRVLKSYTGTKIPKATLMEASPITGRTHQIRVHAEFVGSPVAGDEKYGDELFNREMKKQGLSRLFLHAVSISLPLPRPGRGNLESEESNGHSNDRHNLGKKNYLVIEAPLEESLSQVLLNLSGEAPHD